MKILVACEESQTVTKELRRLGHEAYSCDISDQSGGHPEWHIMQDVLPLINGDCTFETTDGLTHEVKGQWDMLIAHPPCTFLSNAGARWLYAGKKLNQGRYKLGLDAKAFFLAFLNADCQRIAVENPIPSKVYKLPAYTQIVQPYEYGHPWSKKTCLWCKGLEPLRPTDIVEDHKPFCSSGSYSGTHDPKYKGASGRAEAQKAEVKHSMELQKLWQSNGPDKIEGEGIVPMMINGMRVWANSHCQKKAQARRHRKKRIDKKWRKRYGYKWVPELNHAYVADVPGYGKVLICHPKVVDKLEDEKLIDPEKPFRWSMLDDDLQKSLF